ncbi:MAG: SGNH/GDSL hydrolase family protein [Planctomycetia bacterium]
MRTDDSLQCRTFLGRVLVASAVAVALAHLPLRAAEPPVETDPRLHADGKGWKLNRATIKEAARPRVLLVGDSILSGYMAHVIKALEGRAYVDAWVNPYCQSTHLNETVLPDVLANGPYDVVHFNMGLHGWPEGRIKPGTFSPLTKRYVQVIKEKLPHARIIWASSTPVLLEGDEKRLDPVINANILEQNRMAAEVMAEENVPVSDFYSLLADKLELARGGKDKFHWTAPAYAILGEACTESVLEALPQPKP